MGDPGIKFTCPCCGYRVFDRPPGNHEVCPICVWEDDLCQLRFQRMSGSANTVSLEKGQKNFKDFGASTRRHIADARTPFSEDTRDPQWRPLNPDSDNIEEPQRGVPYGDSYPLDTTVLYYWRSQYWRRLNS